MRHVVMTRSAYGPAWDDEANARRLAMTVGVTVASMRAQTSRDWTWLVVLDRCDPLRAERRASFESAGVPVRFLDIDTSANHATAAVEAYRAPWDELIGPRDERIAMTRLDDDDALAPWVLGRFREAAMQAQRRTAFVMPHGVRVWAGRYTVVRHDSNAMHTLVTPPGDPLHVYGYLHRQVRRTVTTRNVDPRLAWLWVRHPDTISGHHAAGRPIPSFIRDMFPIDWTLFPTSTVSAASGARCFR